MTKLKPYTEEKRPIHVSVPLSIYMQIEALAYADDRKIGPMLVLLAKEGLAARSMKNREKPDE